MTAEKKWIKKNSMSMIVIFFISMISMKFKQIICRSVLFFYFYGLTSPEHQDRHTFDLKRSIKMVTFQSTNEKIVFNIVSLIIVLTVSNVRFEYIFRSCCLKGRSYWYYHRTRYGNFKTKSINDSAAPKQGKFCIRYHNNFV